ncbi:MULTISPECIES: hypothetical protein [Rhodococcus]|uniref:hypothetical protein n=1 Tax=Rhodococcus TaxID=1827 RepID=UPI0012EC3AC3|nr:MULTISPECIES: hypothetical protein [Rhodococcus]MBQ9055266.1 hypothetical protein [Rhodococcus sp. (in: high G+C Gram-positive bacteria)]QXC46415.1 hypothetical protein KSE96_29535 [Rhodococcus qingshengii]
MVLVRFVASSVVFDEQLCSVGAACEREECGEGVGFAAREALSESPVGIGMAEHF